jgi:hypothetical protein
MSGYHTQIFFPTGLGEPYSTNQRLPKALPPFFILLASGHVDYPSRLFPSPEDQAKMAISI